MRIHSDKAKERWIAITSRLRHNRGRTLAAGGLLLVAVAAGCGFAFGLGVATFVVVVYGTLFSAFVAVGLQPFPARPELEVAFWRDGGMTQLIRTTPARARQPVDVASCVGERLRAARATVTPKEPPLQAHPFTGVSIATTEPYERSLQRFEEELGEYQAKLTAWLETYESRCWPNYSHISTRIATRNGGETVAEGVTLRIVLPPGIVPLTDSDMLSVKPPPEHPTFKRRSLLGAPVIDPALYTSPIDMPRIKDAFNEVSFVREENHVVAEFRINRLTHGLTHRSDSVVLLPLKPGRYDVAWRAHVGNLREPTSGALTVEVEPWETSGDPLATVEEVLASKYVPIREGMS